MSTNTKQDTSKATSTTEKPSAAKTDAAKTAAPRSKAKQTDESALNFSSRRVWPD